MKDIAGFIKTTLIGGALVILPLALVAILLQKAIGAAHKALQPLASHIPGGTVASRSDRDRAGGLRLLS